MVPKQLIVAVEGTAATGPFWQTIVSDYLEKTVPSFCRNETTSQLSLCKGVAGLEMDIFFQWLSAKPFGGGGFNDAAIAEGLAEALMTFSSPSGSQNQNMDGQRHCVLVAASNPCPFPTPVYRPQPQNLEQNDVSEKQLDSHLSDAETLAKSFAQLLGSISLPVVCPKHLSKLGAIYNAGKRNPRATDPLIDNVKNPHFLLLISENFVEARSALSRPGMTNLPSNQSPVKMDATPVPSIATTPPVSIPSANGSVMGRQPVAVGSMPMSPATIKVTSSPLSTSQEMIPNNEIVPDMKPLVNNMIPSLRPVGGAAANVRILYHVVQARQVLAGGTSIGLPSVGGTLVISNTVSGGMNSIPPAPNVISTEVPHQYPGQYQWQGQSKLHKIRLLPHLLPQLLGMSQPLSNLQSVSMWQTIPGMSQGNLPVTQMVLTGMSMSQNVMSSNGASGMPSGTGAMIPTPGIGQQITNASRNAACLCKWKQHCDKYALESADCKCNAISATKIYESLGGKLIWTEARSTCFLHQIGGIQECLSF